MKWFKILFPLLSGAAMVGLSGGLIASYYNNQENILIKYEKNKLLQEEVHLTKEGEVLFPGESKSYTIEVDLPRSKEVLCSLYFTDVNEKAGSLLTVQVSKGDYQSEEQEIGKLKESSPLTFASTIEENDKDFLLTYKVKEDLGGVSELDASFICHFEVRKGETDGK